MDMGERVDLAGIKEFIVSKKQIANVIIVIFVAFMYSLTYKIHNNS